MKKHFTKGQVKEAIGEYEVETIKGDNRRWVRTMTTIVKMEDGKYYSLSWEQGLTECQENDYYEQDAPEVKQIEETIVVKNWVEV